ncbi:MAG TPA: tetratricopeptide repeat protein, partial [Archangium sp.]|uniref:tetratricopeptide repeat protein n=1 Tax=Archangium sp. TaxID=1872627 RepID=UPI002ED9CCA8
VDQARALAEANLRKNKDDRPSLLTLAKLAAVEGEWQRAEELVKRATRGGKDNDADSLLVQAALASSREQVELARSLYEQVIRTARPPRAEAYFGQGYLLASLEDFAGARKAFEKAVELEPEVAPYRFHLARMCFAQEDLKAALPHLEKALELNPLYPPVYVVWATVLQNLGELETAEELLRKGLELLPNHPELLNLLGNVLVARGNMADAFTITQELAKQFPEDPAAQGNYARMLMAAGHRGEALAVCQELAERGLATVQTKSIEAMVLESQEPPDFEGAAAAYRAAMNLDPEAWAPANNLGNLLLSRQDGKPEENVTQAIQALEEARRREPSRVEPVLNLALAYARQGDKAKSKALASAVVKQNPAPELREQAERLIKALG